MSRGVVDKRPEAVQGMFARIAHRYDLLNRVLSLRRDVTWRRRLARRVAAAVEAMPAERRVVLDVCTGTGDVALTLAGSGLEPVAIDFCVPMLAQAQRKGRRLGRRLPLFAADALRLPVADASVAVITVAFGVRNLVDLDAGLRELRRVLQPGGALLILEFSAPRGALAPVLRWWSRAVPPRLGRWISGDDQAYTYLPESVERFDDRAEMLRRLADAGLDRLGAHPQTGGVATLYEARRPEEAPT
jgi:demethylmenaquinone methyltransferase/2-methoxy-6-polyprenyl-1,4-benzoquinol methylase